MAQCSTEAAVESVDKGRKANNDGNNELLHLSDIRNRKTCAAHLLQSSVTSEDLHTQA